MLEACARYRSIVALMMGGIFTLICDNLARVLLPGEIPLGILTSLLGAALFAFLMISRSPVIKTQ